MVRFDKPCLRVKGAVGYFREHMGIGDYLSQSGEASMTWFGTGAERLGLQGLCRLRDFERLCRRRHPETGDKLAVRDRGAAGRVCYFGQISAPKDVSIAGLVGGDERIRQWWDEAVRETFREMQAVAATRVRTGGRDEDRPTGNLVAAVVTHETSRKLDPQLHTHVCVFNTTFDPVEKRWKSLQPAGLYRHQGFFREVCYAKLAEKLHSAGYEVEPGRPLGFTLKGVPPALREKFSRRRAQILDAAANSGAVSQDALQAIASNSREAKVSATVADLRSRWWQEAGEDLAGLRAAVIAADGTRTPAATLDPAAALRSADEHLFERQSVVDERELLREALIAGRGQVALSALRGELAARLEEGVLLRMGTEIASRDTLAAEEEFVNWADGARTTAIPLNLRPDTAGLEVDQASAVAAILASPSRVMILQGDAGTGKTTCLRAIVAGIEQAGNKVFGCAPSSGAADVLRRELTPEADTLQQLLVNSALQERVRGRVLVVDEAGLISVRQMRDLCRIVRAQDCRLLLVGDAKQHASVEAGDALRCLQRFSQVPAVWLIKIRRQRDPAYRAAVALLARGDARGAFDRFAKMGAVQEIKSLAALYRAAADDYVRTIQSGKTCLAISPVWTEIHAFTAEVRIRLKTTGLLEARDQVVPVVHSLGWTREQMRRVDSYQSGDVLTFHRPTGDFAKGQRAAVVRCEGRQLVVRGEDGAEHRITPRQIGGFDVGLGGELRVAVGDRLLIRANCEAAGLRNGDLVQVSAMAANSGIGLADGRAIPSEFRQFTHGYAATSHAAQGKTVERGILLMGEDGLRASNLRQAYVSNSRFRESQAIYTTDKRTAREAMQRPAERRLASELFARAASATTSFRQFFLHGLYVRARPTALAMLQGRMVSIAHEVAIPTQRITS